MQDNNMQKFSYYFVYKTTCLVNGKIYIGCHSTNDMNDGYLGSGKIIKAAIELYGRESFSREVISYFSNPKDMFEAERIIVDDNFINRTDTYNLVIGGCGGFKVQDIDDWKIKLKQGKKTFADSLSQEELDSFYSDRTNKAWDTIKSKPETLQSIKDARSARVKGKNNPMYGKTGEDNPWYGKSHTQASKDKMSATLTGTRTGANNNAYGKSYVKGRKWYHDGTTSFYLKPDDPKVEELSLIAGRLKRLPKPEIPDVE